MPLNKLTKSTIITNDHTTVIHLFIFYELYQLNTHK